MNFLQPLMLFAVPLITLPIIIHLINQRRYQNMQWGAMQFLLAANRMSRGYARLRQWLILACRTLAIAGLIFAACRPLASGLLGSVGGSSTDTTIILLDRSPSMLQSGDSGTLTKLEASQRQLVDTLQKLGSTHWVLIESDRRVPQKLKSVDALLELPESQSSATADLPQMLDSAAEYIANNKTGRTEVWICSDLRSNDWREQSAEWKQLHDRFLAFPQSIRFHLFGYSKPAPENVAVQVTEVERMTSESGTELAVSLKVTREESSSEPIKIPVQFEIAGARSQTVIELTGKEYELRGHRIPVESTLETGWGRVSIPADSNVADNEFFFAFDKAQPRRSVLVLEDAERAAALQFAAEVPPSASVICESQLLEPGQIDAIAWEEVSLVLWQAPLPEGDAAKLLENFVDRGGQIMFFPPSTTGTSEFRGVRWGDWQEPEGPVAVSTWTMDQDLLANSIGGTSLPVGELQLARYCPPVGELTTLATISGGTPLLSRSATTSGGVYFCSTTPYESDSTLANNGAVLYVAVQRALAQGALALGQARQYVAGKPVGPMNVAEWKQLSGAADAISTDYSFQGGVYEANEQLLAINREAATEDHAAVLSNEQINGLFAGLDFSLVENQIGETSSLVNEIWRAFLLTMMIALLAEALLCVPRKHSSQEDKNSIFRERQQRDTAVKEMQEVA